MKTDFALLAAALGLSVLYARVLAAAPTAIATTGVSTKAVPEDMEVPIKGQFKGRYLVKKIVAPVTMNLEKLQDFPEDPSQRILLDPLPFSQAAEFNARTEVKGHAPFYPWVPAIPEPPFLTMTPPKNTQAASWMFEVFNPQGQTIFRQRGTNALPDELQWEGKDSEKKFAVVDRLYSAQLTLMGADGKATIIQGESVVLPAMIYGSDQSQTVEFSLNRLFTAGKSDLSPEGIVLLTGFCQRVRELGLTKLHVRLSAEDQTLSSEREISLVEALDKGLHLSPGQVEHDHTKPTLRGEIAVFWLKSGLPS